MAGNMQEVSSNRFRIDNVFEHMDEHNMHYLRIINSNICGQMSGCPEMQISDTVNFVSLARTYDVTDMYQESGWTEDTANILFVADGVIFYCVVGKSVDLPFIAQHFHISDNSISPMAMGNIANEDLKRRRKEYEDGQAELARILAEPGIKGTKDDSEDN
jgi:hypothetical protein